MLSWGVDESTTSHFAIRLRRMQTGVIERYKVHVRAPRTRS